MNENFLTVSEAASKLGVSPRTIQRYCKQSRLNHKWVQGKRHKELRILSPIPVSQLPSGRRRSLAGTFDYVSKEDFEKTTSEMKQKLNEKDLQIAVLDEQVSELKSMITAAKASPQGIPEVDLSVKDSKTKLINMLYEYENVRPAEKKLILKLAKEIKEHEKYLSSLGMNRSESGSSNTE